MKKILFVVFISWVGGAYASPVDQIAACMAIKSTIQRLACFDKAAPVIVGHYAEERLVSEKKAIERVEQKQDRENAERIEAVQQQLATDVLRELKKLQTVTRIGVSKVEYSRRLLDSATSIEMNLAEIKNGSFKSMASEALRAYTDANDFWGAMIDLNYIRAFFDRYSNEAARYGVFIHAYQDQNTTFRRQGMTQVLDPVWSTASRAIVEAESALVPQSTSLSSSVFDASVIPDSRGGPNRNDGASKVSPIAKESIEKACNAMGDYAVRVFLSKGSVAQQEQERRAIEKAADKQATRVLLLYAIKKAFSSETKDEALGSVLAKCLVVAPDLFVKQVKGEEIAPIFD